MRLYLTIGLLVPIACMILGLRTGAWPLHIGVTIACAVIVLLTGRGQSMLPLIIGLLVSAIGDYFMIKKGSRMSWYLCGIISFFIGHSCFIWYALPRFAGSMRVWVAGGALVVALAWYLAGRVMPKIQAVPMRIAGIAYAAVSVTSLIVAAGMSGNRFEAVLYAFGILMIVSSDCMIAEHDFVGNHQWSGYIRPLYAMCHILLAASSIAGIV